MIKAIKSWWFVLLCIFFCVVEGNAQMLSPVSDPFKLNTKSIQDIPFDFKSAKKFISPYSVSCTKNLLSVNHLPGMFCKLEYKMETKSKLAPRFRLGSLAYTEWMEGKPGYFQPQLQ